MLGTVNMFVTCVIFVYILLKFITGFYSGEGKERLPLAISDDDYHLLMKMLDQTRQGRKRDTMETSLKDITSELDSSEMSMGDMNWKNKDQVTVLQSYVSELSEQNEILIQTIEDLERDYNQKIATLENRLQKTNVFLKEKSNRCDLLQQTLDSYNIHKNESYSHTQDLEEEVVQMGEENSQYQSHIANLESDLEELITLIRKARTTGKWELSSVDLKAIPIENILDVETIVDPVPRSGTEKITQYHLDELKEQLNARDKTIAMLELELNKKTKEYHSVIDQARHCDEIIDSVKNDVVDLERGKQSDMGHLAQQDILIQKLTNQLKNAEEKGKNLQEHMLKMEDEINELRNSNLILQNAIELRVVEIKHKSGTIEMLEKTMREAKRVSFEMMKSPEEEDMHFQLEMANSKMNNMQEYVNQLEETHESKASQHGNNMKKLQVDLRLATDKANDFEAKIQQLTNQLMKERNKAANLECQLNTRMIEDDINMKKDIDRKEKAMKLLEGQVKRLEEQQRDYENKLMLKDKSMERLQHQQKEYMDEVTKRDETVHSLELKILQIEDDLRKAKNELDRSTKSKDSMSTELNTLKQQHNQVMTEKGKLDAQVKAYQISNKSEHTTLTGEVTKQEEHIRNLLFEKSKLEDDLMRANDEIENSSRQISDLEIRNKDLHKQVQVKDMDLVNVESSVQELRFTKMQNTNKIEELEDEIREMMLKLESSERAKEQEKHKAMLIEEQFDELQTELDTLRNEHSNASKDISLKNFNIDQLTDELNQVKKILNERERENYDLQDNMKKVEHQNTLMNYEVSSMKRDVSEDLQTRDHKIEMLKGDLEIANERYVQVNDELTSAELEVQSTLKKYREVSDMTDQLHKQIKQHNNEVQKLEMELALTSEKHKTCVKENAHKDGAIIKLQSQLDTIQQELDYSVEELTQKTDRLEQLDRLLLTLRDKNTTLTASQDESAKKIEENIEEINILQMKNVELTEKVKEQKENNENLEKEMSEYQMRYENKNRELETKFIVADEDLNMVQQENSGLNFQVTTLSEKNNELLAARDKEADEKQAALFKYEDVIEKFEEHKNEKEGEIKKLSDKVNTLEKGLHESTLKTTQLDGQLKLSNEKLKNCEGQLKETEKSAEQLEENIKSLEAKIAEQEADIKQKVESIEQLENSNTDATVQISQQTEENANLNSQILSLNNNLNDYMTKTKQCEDLIAELREKLTSKVKENEHLNSVITQLEAEHKTLEEIHARVQEELTTSEMLTHKLQEQKSQLEIELDERKRKIEDLESNLKNVNEKLQETVQQKNEANEKISNLNSKFVSLKESVENDNLALLEENCILKQDVKQLDETLAREIGERDESIHNLEGIAQEKIKEVTQLEEKTAKLSNALESAMLELNQKTEELMNSEEALSELHLQVQQILEERKSLVNETTKQTSEIVQLRSDISDYRHQYKECAQQLAHYQEKCMLVERNLNATQEQLSSRITENVKQEKMIRKAHSDSKYTIEDRKSKEVQVMQYEQMLEETKNELEKLREENRDILEENKAQQSALMTYENQLDASQKQTEQLLLEVETQKKIINSSEDSLATKIQKLSLSEIELETQLHELEENKHMLDLAMEREEEIQRRLRDSESSNIQLHAELDNLIQKNRSCQEQISSYDAELRVTKADLEASQKKCSQQEKYMKKCNHQSEKLQLEIRQLKDSSENLKENASEQEFEVNKLRNELMSVQANLDESIEQLTVKTNELSSIRNDLMAVERLHTQSEQQLTLVDGKNKKLKTELKRSLDRIKTSCDEIAQLTQTVTSLKNEMYRMNQNNREQESTLTKKEEELFSLRVDIASIEEKCKVDEEENEALKNEMLSLNQRHHSTLEELEKTRLELEEIKTNGDRLTRESEQVVESMNHWVREQREGNEKLACKVSEQNEKSSLLEGANRKLTEENEKLTQKNRSLKSALEGKLSDIEKYRRHQSQTAQLQVSIKQLKSTNEELEMIIGKERDESKESVSELQNRIKTNVETIQQLHRQLSELNKENLRQRSLLEKQSLSRKNLQAQLKSKENDIESLRDNLDKSDGKSTTVSPDLQMPARFISFQGRTGRNGKVNVSTMLDKELERAGVSSEEALDKSYWIQRVAELSVQLQQSSDYWMQKLNSAAQTNSTFR